MMKTIKAEISQELGPEVCIREFKISESFLGVEGHGIMTFCLYLSPIEGSAHTVFGGLALDSGPSRKGFPFGIEAIRALLETLGVEQWETLRGRHVRCASENPFSRILAIGHERDDKWFLV